MSGLMWERMHHWMDDPRIQELVINGWRVMHVFHSDGSREDVESPLDASLEARLELQRFAAACGVRVDPMQPAAGGEYVRGAEHWRWHMVLPPVVSHGAVFAIRRLNIAAHSWRSIPGMTDAAIERLMTAITQQRTVFVIGPTGAGKTTFMLSLLSELASHERVIFLESMAEVPLLSKHWLRLVARTANIEGAGLVTATQNFTEVLRLRPDRIVLSELRADEMAVFQQILASSHQGTIVTTHATSVSQLRHRLLGLTQPAYQSLLMAQLELAQPLVVVLTRQQPVALVHIADLRPAAGEVETSVSQTWH